ncbi:BA14K-like protein [Bradyrhizobium erythrophlei]|uniref:BA14K-like protein n=1 Tax=Bradyrhizobium erythrophlei TaxID=1437360 RepID=A0A1M7U608_9BRAD|nr:BA14K-like protein [Bradyrhizobium erythrophlei]
MSRLGIVGAAALSLASAVATPAFAVELHGVRGGDLMDISGFGGFQASTGSFVPSEAAAAHCAQRWAYYDRASGKYMGDDGQWRPCV